MRTPRTSPARVLLLALVLGAPALAMPREAQGEAPKADPKKPAPRETLQQFLERLRGLRDGVQTQLAGSVADALRVLEMEAQVRRLPGCEDQKERLVALGAEAAPLLVDRIDPGANGTDAQKLVAQYVAQALAGIPTPSITDKLLAVLKDGSLEGRRNALRVLAVTPEPARVVPLLAQFFQQAQGQVRKDALAALVRIGGKDGVYVGGGYSSYLYTREVKNWRERTIVKFEDANAIGVTVENKNGSFSFSKNGEAWSGSVTLYEKDGKLKKDPEKKWEKFEGDKVKDLLRAFKALNAEDFGDEKSDTGLADAAKEGGVIRIKLKDNAPEIVIKVGKTSKGSSRFTQKEGSDIVYTISSWSADWATAALTKFEKGEKKDEKKEPPPGGDEDGPHGFPPGMEMPE